MPSRLLKGRSPGLTPYQSKYNSIAKILLVIEAVNARYEIDSKAVSRSLH